MSERTLAELSAASKTHFESREWQDATNCLIEARERFPQTPAAGELSRKLVQAGDGSIAVETEKPHPRGEQFSPVVERQAAE